MIGDKLVIEKYHMERAQEICDWVQPKLEEKYVIAVSGESGSGKSELASELCRILTECGNKAGVLGQDDYFVFPPKANHEMRRANLKQVGPYEVKLDFFDSNLRSFKRSENPIYKPLANYEEDSITTEEIDTGKWAVLIAEGTYTALLEYVDLRVFINRDYHQTLKARKQRARDKFEPFVEDVLEREHQIISRHIERADIVIPPDFGNIEVCKL